MYKFLRDYYRGMRWISRQNKDFIRGDQRFLVLLHPGKSLFYYELLHWLDLRFPEIRAYFELQLLPGHIRDLSRYCLCVPWFQDPIQQWSPITYQLAKWVGQQCERQGILVINPVERLTNAAKSTGAQLIASAGIRVPKMARIKNWEEFRETRLGLNAPLFVREDWGHGGRMHFAFSDDEVRNIPQEIFARPVAVEIVDVRDRHDGLYRKYRYVVAGDIGVAQGLQISHNWLVKGRRILCNEASTQEELQYMRTPDPNHSLLVAARKALGLDFVAFDYSYDQQGRMVVWEANPYPHLRFPHDRRRHARIGIRRSFAAMVKLYFERAGLRTPEAMEACLTLQESLPASVGEK